MLSLVADYDSDPASGSESEDEKEPSPPPPVKTASVGPPRPPRSPSPPPGPPPSVSSMLSNLPAARKSVKKKRMVKLQLSINKEALEKDDDEDEIKPKKQPLKAKATSLRDFLPKPKYEEEEALGGGLGFGSMGGTGVQLDLGGGSAGPSSSGADPHAYEPPTAFPGRWDGQVQGQSAGAMTYDTSEDYTPQPHYQYQASASAAVEYAEYPPGASGGEEGGSEDLLTRALQEETERMNRKRKQRDDPFGKNAMPAFVEINQSQLTSGQPMVQVDATRQALGPQYAAQLRKEAGDAPDKVFRRKHQINALYHDAKMRELDLWEQKSKGLKTKAQTHGKYGWI